MKNIITVLTILSLFSCKNNDFNNYLNSLNTLKLPIDFKINSKLKKPPNYSKTLFKKFKHQSTSYPYGIIFKNDKSVGIIEASIADTGIAPFIITYNLKGEKVDSLNILKNIGFGEKNQTLEYGYLDRNLNLTITDSTKSWLNNSKHSHIQSSTTIKTIRKQYHINKIGVIKKVSESKPQYSKPFQRNQLSGIYEYQYEHNTDDLIENHYLEFQDGKAFYYGTSDDFDESREGYLPGFFKIEILNLKITDNKIDFTIDIDDSDLYKNPIIPLKKVDNNNLWGIEIQKKQRRYTGNVNDNIIILKSQGIASRNYIKK